MNRANMSATRRIDGGELDRLALALRRLLELPRLHDGRMQIEIMRHHGRAQECRCAT